MAAKSGMVVSRGGGNGPKEETSTTRRRIQDVLGQARAALRQSQQFRHNLPANSKNNNLGNRLQFQQQPQEDYWSNQVVGGVATTTSASIEKDKHSIASVGKHDTDDTKSRSSYRSNKQSQDDNFGMPFRDALKKFPQAAMSSITKTTSQHRKVQLSGVSSFEQISSDASTTSISMSTNELRVSSVSDLSSSEESPEENSQGSVKQTIKSATTTRSPKRVKKLEELKAPSVVKTPIPIATGKVQIDDDMGFSRAHIMKSEEDPHLFEKAGGEKISESAYKAFNNTQSTQLQQQQTTEANNNNNIALSGKKQKPIFSNLTDPEYTADWISDAGLTSSLISVVDMPISDYIKDEDVGIDSLNGETEFESVVDDDEVNTESMIRTATELEQSGILEEISENLHSVLDISDHQESQNFSAMSAEENIFTKEYDEAIDDADEPLQSIFLDKTQDNSSKKVSLSGTGQDETTNNQRITSGRTTDAGEEDDDYDYDNTFIQMDSTVSSVTKSVSKPQSSKSKTLKSSSTMVSKEKKYSTSVVVTNKSSKSLKVKGSTSNATSGGGSNESAPEKSKSKTSSKSKSYASTSSTTSKRINSLPIPPDPPTSRHQKNIQNLLEKEVYQKELRRIRSEKLKDEKHQARMQKIAKESLERNKKGTWKDPDYTEILLPELFKYKSVSDLQAAKRSMLAPSMNFGAPYFQMNGAISGTDGAESILAAARVESLDIPDLVREVLASNERMYRMTVEASEQMAKKAYKNKLKKESSKNVGTKR